MSPAKKPVLPIDIYCRVSTVGDRDMSDPDLTAKRQVERCRDFLKGMGLDEGEVFEDLDKSGGDVSRPDFDRAYKRAIEGESGGIISVNLSRFGRHSQVMFLIEELEAAGAAVLSVEERFDTSSPAGKAFAGMLAVFNKFFRDQKKAEWAGRVAEQIDRGIHPGSTPPFGYARTFRRGPDGAELKNVKGNSKLDKLVPHPVEAELVREAFKMRARGEGWVPIGAYLRTHSSGNWGVSVVSRMIGNKVYLGVAYAGEHENLNAHEPIVSRDLFNAANAKRQPGRKRGASTMQLLTGILKCDGCGLGLTSSSAAGGAHRSYRCLPTKSGRCECRAYVRASDIEDFILGKVRELLTIVPKTIEDPAEDDRAQAERNLEAATNALDELVNSDEDIPASVFAARARKLEADVTTAQDALDAIGIAEVDTVIARTFEDFEGWTIPEQRAFIAHAFGTITVAKANGTKDIAERVTIAPKTRAAMILGLNA